jgi:hypothetical protein
MNFKVGDLVRHKYLKTSPIMCVESHHDQLCIGSGIRTFYARVSWFDSHGVFQQNSMELEMLIRHGDAVE